MEPIITGITLIRKTGMQDQADARKINARQPLDPAQPFRLDVNLRQPEFMEVTWALLYGGSEVVVIIGETVEALQQFITLNNLRTHPRLRWLTITDAANKVVDRAGHDRAPHDRESAPNTP